MLVMSAYSSTGTILSAHVFELVSFQVLEPMHLFLGAYILCPSFCSSPLSHFTTGGSGFLVQNCHFAHTSNTLCSHYNTELGMTKFSCDKPHPLKFFELKKFFSQFLDFPLAIAHTRHSRAITARAGTALLNRGV